MYVVKKEIKRRMVRFLGESVANKIFYLSRWTRELLPNELLSAERLLKKLRWSSTKLCRFEGGETLSSDSIL
jgi:hypothetical protein